MDPTHPHNQVETASAPLRLCARLFGSGWGNLMHLPFSDDPIQPTGP